MKGRSAWLGTGFLLAVLFLAALQFGPTSHATISTVNVSIHASSFDPGTITVVIGVNNTVAWTNNDAVAHTVTADGGSFGSGNLGSGSQFTRTFATPGTFGYHCVIHPFMSGTVIVLGSPTSTTSTSSTSTSTTTTASGGGQVGGASIARGMGKPFLM